MEPRLLLLKFLAEAMGMRLIEERPGLLLLQEGLNRVAVRALFAEIYEEAELYKAAGEALATVAEKAYLAVLPPATPYLDSRYLKSQGLGLIVVDPSKGPEGVEVRLHARPRPLGGPPSDPKALESLRAALWESLRGELKRLEEALYERIKLYIDRRLEELRRQAVQETHRQEPPRPSGGLLDNEWVRVLRERGSKF